MKVELVLLLQSAPGDIKGDAGEKFIFLIFSSLVWDSSCQIKLIRSEKKFD